MNTPDPRSRSRVAAVVTPQARTNRLQRDRRSYLALIFASVLSVAGLADPGPRSSSPATPKPTSAAAPTERDKQLKDASQDPAIVKQGREIFAALCQACHGSEATQGEAASNLFDAKWHHGDTPAQIERTILSGVLDKGMPGWSEILPAEDTTALTAYLLSAQK